jgi:hypothetical protein
VKVEKVVNPPRKPKTINVLNSLLITCFSNNDATTPMKKDPIKLTVTVPIGKFK